MNDENNSRLELPDELLTVRGRPVAYFTGNWGGHVRATERGYFPISETGYRSLSCGQGARKPSQDQLDKLANEHERTNIGVLRACSTALATARGDALSRYVHVVLYADAACSRGFFAPDDVRIALWQHAHRLYTAIAECRRFQPAPVAPDHAWNPAHCARAIDSARAAVPWLARLLAGDIAPPPEAYGRYCIAANAYLKLPPRQTPEPVGAVPASAQAFAFVEDLADTGPLADDEGEPKDLDLAASPMSAPEEDESVPSPTLPDSAGAPQPAQLSLF